MSGSGAASRRDFLRRAGLIATGAAVAPAVLSACGSGRSPSTTFDSVIEHPASESGIDTVVVVTMENRSFDHLVGGLATDAAYLEAGRRRYGPKFRVDGAQHQTYPDPQGREFTTAPLVGNVLEPDPYRGCSHPVPGHGWTSGRAQLRRGFLGKNTGNDEYALGYFTPENLPFHPALAQRFTVCDHWHAPLMAGTFPNRQYLHAATSDGNKEDPIPLKPGVFTGPTIWDRLHAANVSARYYYVDLPILSLWDERHYDRISVVDHFFEDAAAGTLPSFSMVDPGFRGPKRSDDHTYADVRIGQRFLREVFNAFSESKQWERGLFILTYDEWGGFFDHVHPPIVPDDRTSTDWYQDFGQTGFRVPTIVASPRSRTGAVDHTLYDHTSILRFLEWRFLGAPARGPGGDGRWWLTKRDRHTNNPGAALSAGKADPDVGFDLDMALAKPQPPCGPVQPTAPGAPEGQSADWDLDQSLVAMTQNRFLPAGSPAWLENLDF